MATLNQIKANRVRSESDMAVVREARELQRRIDCAIATERFPSRLIRFSKQLHHWRAGGFPADLHWFMSDFGEAIETELRMAEMRAINTMRKAA